MGFISVMLEGNEQVIVNALKSDGDCPGSYDSQIADTCTLSNSFQSWNVNFVRKEGNVAAHQLACMAIKLKLN